MSTAPTQTLAELAAGPIECAPWCEDGDGHRDVQYSEDQWCASPHLTVDLSLHPAIPGAFLASEGVWASSPDYVRVYAFRRAGEATHIELTHADAPAFELTPAEARQLVEALQLVLGQIAVAR